MSDMKLEDLSKAMADIDFTMLATHSDGGAVAMRPMSNNGDVKYEGDSYFFALSETRTVRDIEKDPRVSLSLQGKKILPGPPMFIAVEGRAELIRDKAIFEKHWNKDLSFYFEEGIDTPGLVLIKVKAGRIHYWNGKDEGEVTVGAAAT